ncbi:E3 ubiquitin-protein ligase TRIM33-like [Mya arenaria]|nr:E3 ubiquitin-protein ligase TRIM33-like [Mya arenaria]
MEVSGRKMDPEISASSAEVTPLCEPCRSDGKELEAHGFCNNCKEYMCPSCIQYHGKLMATKHHNVLGKQKMPTHDSSRKKAADVSCLELCQNHPSEAIKFFCPAHAQLSCGDCIVLDHRSCTVDYIPEVAPSFTASNDFQIIVDKSARFDKDLKKCDEKLNVSEQSVMDLSIIELKKIQDFRLEINEYLDKREKILIESMDSTRKKDTAIIRRLQEDINALKTTLAETKAGLKAQNKNANQLYVTAKRTEKLFKELESLIKKVETGNLMTQYKFSRDKKTEDLLSWEDAIGKVDTQTREAKRIELEQKLYDLRKFNEESMMRGTRDQQAVKWKFWKANLDFD